MRYVFCDLSGIVRGVYHWGRGRPAVNKGLLALNILDQGLTDNGLDKCGIVFLQPDEISSRADFLFSSLQGKDGSFSPVCSRSFLKRQLAEAEKRGLILASRFCPEFIVGTGEGPEFKPLDRGAIMSLESMHAGHSFISALLEELAKNAVSVESYRPGFGAGQHMFALALEEPLKAVDNYLVFKEIAKELSIKKGLSLTFAPKRSVEEVGNNCTLSLKIVRDSNTRIDNEPPAGELSQVFAAGVHTHIKALCALLNPSVNSYRRLKPGSFSIGFSGWGNDNIFAAVSIDAVYDTIDLNTLDCTANPYLALGAAICAGLDGLGKAMKLPLPLTINPLEMSEDECFSAGVERLPANLNEALTELETDLVLMKALGAELANAYIVIKTSEALAQEGDPAYEFLLHRQRY